MTVVPRGSRETSRSAGLGRQRLMATTVARYNDAKLLRHFYRVGSLEFFARVRRARNDRNAANTRYHFVQ
jgi:hypothetical protein